DIDPMHFQLAYRGAKSSKKPMPRSRSDPAFLESIDKQKEVPFEIFSFFVKAEFTREQASGIVANVEAESDFDPHNVGDGGRAHGLFQMHPDRRTVIRESADID